MKKLLILAAIALPMGGCLTVAKTPNGEWVPVIPLGGEVAESNLTKAGNAAAAVAPYADLLLPGAGVALTGILGALGYGSYRGRKNTEEKYEKADEWYKEGLAMPQARVIQEGA